MSKKQSNVPVFLIYAGVIHAIGLALLLPMLVTLPGPGSETTPEAAAIDVEIIPASPLAGKIEQDSEQTSALPSTSPRKEEDAAVKPDEEAEAVATVSPEAEPDGEQDEAAPPQEEPEEAASPAEEKAKPEAAMPAKASQPEPAKKPVTTRRTAKPHVRRAAKTQIKIAPFNGALSGLFSPGAPAKRR